MTLAFQGKDAGGILRQGTVDTDDPTDVIRQFWPLNWPLLAVTEGAVPGQGIIVGLIGKRKGRRQWMAYSTGDPDRWDF